MDHYGLRHSGSIGHVEYVPAQVTIFAWYTVFSAWLLEAFRHHQQLETRVAHFLATKNQMLFSVFPVKMTHHDPSHSL